MKYVCVLILLFSSIQTSQAQEIHNFKNDSLQFKIYGNITYKAKSAVKLKVTKVFCNYCNKKQLGYLTQVGWRNMYISRNNPNVIIEDGQTKRILFIRVAKEAFRKLK